MTISIEDTPDGVCVSSSLEYNGTTDHPAESLAAMWAASLWTYMQTLRRQSHAVIHELPIHTI